MNLKSLVQSSKPLQDRKMYFSIFKRSNICTPYTLTPRLVHLFMGVIFQSDPTRGQVHYALFPREDIDSMINYVKTNADLTVGI